MAVSAMELVIKGPKELKQFSKILSALSKIGDKLNLDPKTDRLKLSAVNAPKSAFAIFHLLPRFFESYQVVAGAVPCCSLNVKSMLSIFKSRNLETNVVSCVIQIHTSGPDADRIVIQVHCSNGVHKTHKLHYEAVEAIHAVYTKQNARHLIKGSSRFVREFLNNFHSRLDEITMDCGPDHIKLTSFNEWSKEADVTKNGLRTELALQPSDFDEFSIPNGTKITINFKELKSVLAFSDLVEQPVTMHFEGPGRPLVLSVAEDNAYIADFVMATIVDDDEEDAAPGTNQAPAPSNAQQATNGVRATSPAPRATNGAQPSTAAVPQTSNVRPAERTQKPAPSRPAPAATARTNGGLVGASAQQSAPQRGGSAAYANPTNVQAAGAPTQQAGAGTSGQAGGMMMSRVIPITASANNFMPNVGSSMMPMVGATMERPLEGDQHYWEQDDQAMADRDEDDEELPPTPPKRQGRLLF